MKYDTPYVLLYKEREPGFRAKKGKSSEENKEVKAEYPDIFKDGQIIIPETLKNFVQTDNE